MDEVLKLRIYDLNPHIVCFLCAGYFIDATTITECLHTFCKSCIVKCLQNSKHCPQCNTKIHETQPLSNLKPDRVMQDIIYKLIPGLFENEEKRKIEFYKSRGLIKERKAEDKMAPPTLTTIYDHPEAHYYSNDQQVSLCLENYSITPEHSLSYTPPPLPRKFMRCSVRTLVWNLHQFLQQRLAIPTDFEVDILCCDSTIEKRISLKQLWIMKWFNKPSPLMLYYRVRPAIITQPSTS